MCICVKIKNRSYLFHTCLRTIRAHRSTDVVGRSSGQSSYTRRDRYNPSSFCTRLYAHTRCRLTSDETLSIYSRTRSQTENWRFCAYYKGNHNCTLHLVPGCPARLVLMFMLFYCLMTYEIRSTYISPEKKIGRGRADITLAAGRYSVSDGRLQTAAHASATDVLDWSLQALLNMPLF